MYSNSIKLFIFSLIFLFYLNNSLFSQNNFVVKEIKVEGNQRVSINTILSYLAISVGDEIDDELLDKSIDTLFATKLFKNVSIDRENTKVIINIEENPIINKINIEGNDVLKDEALLAELNIKSRRVFTKEQALQASQKLLEIYRKAGRYSASVEPKIIPLDSNRVNVVFEVDEGPLIKIEKIRFIGNKIFSDYALRQVIASRENRWWAFLSSSDKYDEDRIKYDTRLLRQFYLSRGYADISVKRAQGGLLPDKSGFAITFQIEEGRRYKLKNIQIISKIENLQTNDLFKFVPLEIGDWYNARKVEEGLLNISNELGNFGYAFVNVRPKVQTFPDTSELNLEIEIGESSKNFVERIEVVNNTRTLDTVVRREMEIVEGDPYNQLKIDRSLRNIRNLGFFKKVEIENIRGSSDSETITKIKVEEQSTGSLSAGIGYSSLDKGSFTLGINEKNFLGTGRSAKFAFSISESRTDYRIGITEPYFLNRNLKSSFEIFNEKVKNDNVTVQSSGVSVGAAFSAANDIYHRLGYEIAETKTTQSNSSTSTSVTGEENKKLIKSSVSYTLGRSTLNNRFDPSEGFIAQITETYSGVGGDVTFLKSQVKTGYYVPYYYNTFTLGLRAKAGYVDGLGEKVTQSSRFYLGGRSVRGFRGGGIGPRDTGTNASVGGNYMYAATAEVISKYGFNDDLGFRWTVFTDVGSVWSTDYPAGVNNPEDDALRQTLGFGLLWDTAIGPLTFFWANAIKKEPQDKTRVFQFNIGTRL